LTSGIETVYSGLLPSSASVQPGKLLFEHPFSVLSLWKRQAVDDHAKSANHKQAIAIEMTMRVSVFHKESTEKGCSNKSFPGCTLADEGRSPE
jgi:hypothetical protein